MSNDPAVGDHLSLFGRFHASNQGECWVYDGANITDIACTDPDVPNAKIYCEFDRSRIILGNYNVHSSH